jgi:hypothetical protein
MLTPLQKDIIIPLARQTVECPNKSKEQSAAYDLLRSALRAYHAYEYQKVLAQNDSPELWSNGGALIWYLIDPTHNEALPADLLEESLVVHPVRGVGQLLYNNAENGLRIIVVDFWRDGITWMKSEEKYLGFVPPA